MSVFLIPPINPIRFIQPGGRLDRLSAAELLNSFQQPECYAQKWQTDDVTTIQVLSEFEFTFRLFDLATAGEVDAIVPVLMDTSIVGQSFSVYQVTLSFAGLDPGYYYCQVDYTDENEEEISLISEPLNVEEEHPETLLFSYRNSENNFSVVFDTGIEFRVRVEGVIELFNPETDDVIYNDQMRNATLLDSIPYRSWTLYIGNAPGVAYWMCDLINRVMSCDGVEIDGDAYTKKVGSAWEMKRAEEYPLAGMTVEIVPVENRFMQRIKTGSGTGTNPGDIIAVQKIKNYTDITGSLAVTGTFKDRTLLEKICIIRTGTAFNMKVGITDGGAEVGEFQIVDLITTITVNHLFDAPVTLYLTGLGTITFLSLIYKQLDEKPVSTVPSGPGVLGKGATIIYTFADTPELDAAFNIESGLGIEETLWEGWAICDGRNGTVDMGDLVPVGYKFESELGEVGDAIGAEEVTLAAVNMPEHEHFSIADASSTSPNISDENSPVRTRTSGGNSDYNVGGSPVVPTLGKTSKAGNEEPEAISVIQPSRIVMWVQKIAD